MKFLSLSIIVQLSFASFALAEPMYGVFMIVKGHVTFQNQNAKIETAHVGAKVFEGAIITSDKDSRAKIVMSDRNVLNISPETKLIIQKYENTPQKKNASLSLQVGKVRINVEQKYDGEKSKFEIKTPTIVAGVRGTQFVTSYDAIKHVSQITTFSGSVNMTSFNSAGLPISSVTVEKGQTSSATVNKAPEPPKTLPKDEIKELDKSTSAASGESKNKNNASANSDQNKPKESKNSDVLGKDQSLPPAPKLADIKDTDTDLAKDIKVPTESGTKRPVLPPPPMPPKIPIPQIPDLPRSAIQIENSKTTVTIHIK